MEKSNLFWQTYLNLEKELLNVAKYIYITDIKQYYKNGEIITEFCDSQLAVFSPHIADLLVRTCIEIEAISKELYFDFGGEKRRGDKELFFDTDCLKLIDQKCSTHSKIVIVSCISMHLAKEENLFFKPLKEAHKRQGTDWEKAYQALKHDRYSSISKGTIKALIHAMGALYLLNIYYRDMKLSSKYLEVSKIDFSLGSAIFSVKEPSHDYIVSIINNQELPEYLESGDSPFVLKYTNGIGKKVLAAHRTAITLETEHILAQPEIHEVEFQKYFQKSEEEAKSKNDRSILLWELYKYKMNKKFPNTLPFEKRKKLLIESDNWRNNRIRLNNHPKKAEEITEDNIQNEIDNIGVFKAMELQQGFENEKMLWAFTEGNCELVLDKGDVKYEL